MAVVNRHSSGEVADRVKFKRRSVIQRPPDRHVGRRETGISQHWFSRPANPGERTKAYGKVNITATERTGRQFILPRGREGRIGLAAIGRHPHFGIEGRIESARDGWAQIKIPKINPSRHAADATDVVIA